MQPSENHSDPNDFQAFFEDNNYILLKNHLYNYRLRKRSINQCLDLMPTPHLIVEVGSGISPVVTGTDRIVYSDMSFAAISYLKRTQKRGMYVVADGTKLPFKTGIFSNAVCSEVLEHIEADTACLAEMNRVLLTDANLIITVPHRQAYFGIDDSAVSHHRRYEIDDIERQLQQTGFQPDYIKKVLGPMEKLTMWLLFFAISLIKKGKEGDSNVSETSAKSDSKKSAPLVVKLIAPIFKWCNSIYMLLVWADAEFLPRSMSTVLLISATAVAKPRLGKV